MTTNPAVTGIVLSGGRGRRVGGADKGLLPWGDSSRIEALLEIFSPQVDKLIISCNRNLERYNHMAPVLVADRFDDYRGPLAGISAALAVTQTGLAACVPCDCPEPPADLVARLLSPLWDKNIDLAFAHDGVRAQYLFCAMRRDLLESLDHYLTGGGRAVQGWHRRLNCAAVDFSDCPEKFANHNRRRPRSKAAAKNPSR